MNSSAAALLLLWENPMVCCCLALLSVSVILLIALYIQCTKWPKIHILLLWPRRINRFIYQPRYCPHIETSNWPGNEAARRTDPFIHQRPHIETSNWPGNEAARRTNQQPLVEIDNSATRRKRRRRANREQSRLQTSTVPSPAPMDCSDTVTDLKEEVCKLNAQLVEENDKLKEEASQLNAQLVEEKDKLKKVLDAQLGEEKDKHNNCVVCFENKHEVLLKPCNHFCLCVSCLPKLTVRCCPICNQTFSDSEKIFHA